MEQKLIDQLEQVYNFPTLGCTVYNYPGIDLVCFVTGRVKDQACWDIYERAPDGMPQGDRFVSGLDTAGLESYLQVLINDKKEKENESI